MSASSLIATQRSLVLFSHIETYKLKQKQYVSTYQMQLSLVSDTLIISLKEKTSNPTSHCFYLEVTLISFPVKPQFPFDIFNLKSIRFTTTNSPYIK